MKHARDLHSIMAMETFVINDVCMIGLINTLIMHSITSAEYMSLKELVAMLLGIKIVSITITMAMIVTMIITSLMIYLATADQLHKHNTMIVITQRHIFLAQQKIK